MAQSAVALPAQVTMESASAALRTVEAALAEADGTLRVNASAVTELDTAAIALLLHARRLAQQRGLGFELQGAPDKMAALSRLYGVDSLLGSAPSDETSGPSE